VNDLNRRELLVLGSTTILLPLAARAQQKAMPVVGFLSSQSPPSNSSLWLPAFHQALRETGYVVGQNVAIEYRWAEAHLDRLPALAADLVSRKVDLIVISGGTPPARAAKDATSTIPIVFATVGDPVGAGLVASLARPGGNITGFSTLSIELASKRLELLLEIVPTIKVVALLINPADERQLREVEEAGHAKGVQLQILKAGSDSEIDAAFAELHAGALFVATDLFFNMRRTKLVALASRYAVPAVYEWREWVALGGLISYGPSLAATYRQVGVYAGRILKGEKPADLPVQQPTRFELVINLKTAEALGLTVPPSIFARADEVIE
jgi:putative ABC transport system substrate-binding protein